MPRKVLAPARAALRFARGANGECGAPPPARRGIRALAQACVRQTSGRSAGALTAQRVDAGSGISIVTAVPRPGSEATITLPLSAATRSRMPMRPMPPPCETVGS